MYSYESIQGKPLEKIFQVITQSSLADHQIKASIILNLFKLAVEAEIDEKEY